MHLQWYCGQRYNTARPGPKTKSAHLSTVPKTAGTSYAAANVPNNTTFGTNGSIYNVYNATKHSTLTVSLAVASWNTTNKTISVTASGVTASNLVLVSPAPASTAVYSAAGVYCSAQASNSLTFTCSSIPTAAVTVNVVILS